MSGPGPVVPRTAPGPASLSSVQWEALVKLSDDKPHIVSNRNFGVCVAYPTAAALDRRGVARMALQLGAAGADYVVWIIEEGRKMLAERGDESATTA